MRLDRPIARVVVVSLAVWIFALAGTSYGPPPPGPVPEIDPNSFGSVLAVLMGSLALLERRKFL